ncbi:MAG: beta strand repeat-containing protein [Planctomycetaceae bacterium]
MMVSLPRRSITGLAVAVVAGAFAGSTAPAALVTWDNGGATQLWSTTTNWDPDGAVAGNDAVFTNVGASGTATASSIVDSSVAVNSLSFLNSGTASAQRVAIANGQTLSVTGLGAAAFNIGGTGTTASSYVVMTGSGGTGSFVVNAGGTSSVTIGAGVMNASNYQQFLDASGLASVSITTGTLAMGNGQRNSAVVTLGGTNSLTTVVMHLGGNATTGGAQSSLTLGQSNTIVFDAANVGNGRSGGAIQFRSGLTNPTVTIANRVGGGANLYIGNLDTNASGGAVGSVDFSGGTVTGTFNNVQIGRGANGTAGGSSTGSVTFGAGSITGTTIYIGQGNTGSSTSATGIGVVTMTAASGTFTGVTTVIGRQPNSAGSSPGSGTFAQNGGTAVLSTLTLGDRNNTTAAGNVSATYALAGGLLRSGTIQAGQDGTGGGTATRVFNWTGGTIQNLAGANLMIAGSNALALTLGGTAAKSFTVDAGRTITLGASLTGTGGFSKDGLGTLLITGSAGHTGPTSVNSGTLRVNGSLTSSAISIATGAVVGGTGSLGSLFVGAATLAPGNSIGTLSTGGLVLNSASVLAYELQASTFTVGGGVNDLISTTGDLTLDGTLQVTELGGSFTPGTYRLVNYTGALTNNVLTIDSTFLATYPGSSIDTATTGQVNLVVVPEPATAVLVVAGAAAGLVLRRRLPKGHRPPCPLLQRLLQRSCSLPTLGT